MAKTYTITLHDDVASKIVTKGYDPTSYILTLLQDVINETEAEKGKAILEDNKQELEDYQTELNDTNKVEEVLPEEPEP